MSKKDRKDQYLHNVDYNEVLVIDENMGLCLYITVLVLKRLRYLPEKVGFSDKTI